MTNYVVLNDGIDTGTICGEMGALVQGQSGLVIVIPVKKLNGEAFSIVGATSIGCSMRTFGTSTVVDVSGTLADNAGVLNWTTSSPDVGTAGTFSCIFDWTQGGIEYRTHPVLLEIIEDPAATEAQNDGINYLRSTGDTSTGLIQFDGTDHAGLKLLSLTTTERNALTPAEGMLIYNETTSTVQGYQGGAWVDVGGGGNEFADNVFRIQDEGDATKEIAFQASGITTGTTRTITVGDNDIELDGQETLIIACSDETTDLTTGTAKVTFRMPFAMTLTAVRASVTTAPTGAALTVDINESGTTVLSTKLTIDATEKTSETAATPPVISDSALADDAEITIDIDQIGSSVAGAGLKVTMIGYR